jgi:hypothetical protein
LNSSKEFTNENIEKYGFEYQEGFGKRHPIDIPEYELIKFCKF